MEKGYTINVLDKGYVRLIDYMGTDERICEAARISYKSPSKGMEQDQKLINYLWKHKHLSPFEQVFITFNIKLPLFVQGQMVRHRTQKLNQRSFRYTEVEEHDFYIPEKWRMQDTKNKQGSYFNLEWDNDFYIKGHTWNNEFSGCLHNHCLQSYTLYKKMIFNKISREMARMVLPQNFYTEIYSTWDLRNLLHFITLRDENHAQWEIQEYAKAIKVIVKELFPMTYAAYDKYKWKLIEI